MVQGMGKVTIIQIRHDDSSGMGAEAESAVLIIHFLLSLLLLLKAFSGKHWDFPFKSLMGIKEGALSLCNISRVQ